MRRTVSFTVSVVALLVVCLASAPLAGAEGLHEHRALRAANQSQASPLIAPRSTCPFEEELAASPEVQEQAMQCMIDFARQGSGLQSVEPVESLAGSADLKVRDILDCGRGQYGTPRSIFIAWMQSPTHRHIILNDFSQVGISVRLGDLGFYGRVRVWVGHFGTQCEGSP